MPCPAAKSAIASQKAIASNERGITTRPPKYPQNYLSGTIDKLGIWLEPFLPPRVREAEPHAMSNDSLMQRLVHLESVYAMLQKDFEDQNRELHEQRRQVEKLEMAVRRLSQRLQEVADSAPEPPRTLEDDRPPHY